MTDESKIASVAVPLSRRKLAWLSIGSGAFVVGGIWLWTISADEVGAEQLKHRVVAVAAIGFFGLCFVVGCRKLFDRRPGLIVDQNGLEENSSGTSAGRVPWTEITALRVVEMSGQRFLAIETIEPHKYLNRGNLLQRRLKAANHKLVGTPITISAHALRIDFNTLVDLIAAALERSRSESE